MLSNPLRPPRKLFPPSSLDFVNYQLLYLHSLLEDFVEAAIIFVGEVRIEARAYEVS
jgi:hypothetical protein